jgi:F-type H+-transporting ATPase subunit delta
MTLTAVATRYANALADIVTARGSALTADTALRELQAFQSVVRQSPELAAALETPAVAGARKKAVIGRLVELLKLSPMTRNFLYVLTDHRRIGSLAEIIRAFETAMDERMGIVPAEVASAFEMDEWARASLAAELEKLTGKRIRMSFAVNHSLIGGVVAKVGSTLYDGSVRGSLESLGRRLSAER